jgi:myo-inositol catabolism protein IolC
MLEKIWINIRSWFQERSERRDVILGFNQSAKAAFIEGIVPTLLEASISRGNKDYKHQFSDYFNSGFRIKAFKGEALSKDELSQIGATITSDDKLIRQLVVLGFDTLEIYGDKNYYGMQWPIRDFIRIGQAQQ